MTVVFCDLCGNKIERNVIHDRIEFETVKKRPDGTDLKIMVKVMVGTNGIWNKGDLCSPCLISTVEELPTVEEESVPAEVPVQVSFSELTQEKDPQERSGWR